ncbi:hypothetical protein JCM10914A_09470 [Paenibacillus sp. JCM 10914]|uniref:hypothetical protein n=1 Tax=Paenibacillus sp. JCM 10914 TaxID=1236974 RepID=UPI0003CCBBA2|nr:hypothetical protein [Paenibacillus sp. JCM 10914]GAE07369.1 hypothetical protein JCM10914_3594 [Paenibacillus sp. JCM 10914]
MFQLNGIVGGKSSIEVSPGKTIQLQQIVINVKNGKKLILKDINFLFNNDAFAIKVEALPSPGVFVARGGAGDLHPNKVLFNNNTGSAVLIFLVISAVNTARNRRSLSRSDSWHLNLWRQ